MTAAGARIEQAFLETNRRLWPRLPATLRRRRPVQAYGRLLHRLSARTANREMYLGTLFLRNRPALELMRRLVDRRAHGSNVRIAVVGCSIGVEVYSILWTLRRARPDLTLEVCGVDIEPKVIEIAETGIYGPDSSETVHESIFRGLSDVESAEMFEWDGDEARVRPWLREGVQWLVGDASDPALAERLGPQDLVVACNFLCHLTPAVAERCLRNLAGLVVSGGHIFVSGVDLDVRTAVARDLGWQPLPDLLAEIHDGDPLVRRDWPLAWWGLEPLDTRRPDWSTRYAAFFRAGGAES